ncbi:class I SAM-dependent methyltransferase [Nocardia sp. NPDC058176]|uniref:class I SAM-dependent methyltransferase n=1 Tax=Nocardia sp. NPDC058176 TaxID=3346368 RepID=UPI0036DC2433
MRVESRGTSPWDHQGLPSKESAARRGSSAQVSVLNRSMDQLPFPDQSFDLIWAEGSIYTIGFDPALRAWRRLLAPGGALAITEIEWTTDHPDPAVRAYWDAAYPLRTHRANIDAARSAGYRLHAHWPLPESDWWQEYYTPLTERMTQVDADRPGMSQALGAVREEISLRTEHGGDYNYAAYILRPDDHVAVPGPPH